MTAQPTVRLASDADFDGIGRVQRAAWTQGFGTILRPEILEAATGRMDAGAADLPARLRELRAETAVAVLDEEVVGYACYGPSRDEGAEGGTAELMTLHVDPDHWGRGIGSLLIGHALSRLRAEGYEGVTLWTFADNDRANRAYERHGFERDGEGRRDDRHGGVLEVRMSRSLGGPPRRRLAPAARAAWTLGGAVTLLPAGIVAGTLAQVARAEDASGLLTALPWMAFVLYAVAAVAVVPTLRWRRWRWEIHEDEVEIQHGAFNVTRTLIPIRRIQHVDSESGLLQQMLGLATVTLHTAAGENEIPQLKEEQARRVRDRIAALTRDRDEL